MSRNVPELAQPRSLPPMPRLVDPPEEIAPDTFAARLYLMLAPLAREDPANRWSLLLYCNAIGTMFQEVDDLVRDTPEGPGWSELLDLARCPPEALAWLAQFVGVRLPNALDEQQQRDWIASTDGFRRGTPAAMTGAAAATLTGTRQVFFRERDGAALGHPESPEYAYCLTVATFANETPDPAATLAALVAQKPGGLLLAYHAAEGQDYETVRLGWASYAALKAAFADYFDVLTNNPI